MILKPYFLRLHRWITLGLALPLIVIILSGLVLSFEPLAQRMRPGAPVTEAELLALLDRHDPGGKATGLGLRTYDGAVRIGGVGSRGIDVDLVTGQARDGDGWAGLFGAAKVLHEKLLFDLEWLVVLSTVAMLLSTAFGVAMGWPRLRNTWGGWHRLVAWVALPLIVLSPLTGLAVAFGIGVAGPAAGPPSERPPVREAVRLIARDHALADLTSLRQRGGRLIARIYEGERLSGFVVTREGLQRLPPNWPRALHEGNWHASWGSLANALLSLVLVGLWGSGLLIWSRRQLRRRRSRQPSAPATTPGGAPAQIAARESVFATRASR